MTPKKIFLFSSLAFVVLCAITLAYYLPKLRPEAGMSSNQKMAAEQNEPSPEVHKPDVDREIVQSIPVQPDKTELPKQVVEAKPPPPKPAAATPVVKTEPDRKLVELLKNPPIQFEISSAKLTSPSRQYLDEASSLLKKQPHIKLMIEGHTDSQDRLGKNQVLSEERAKAVLTYLTGKGIAPERLASAGYGGSKPIADNETAEGRAKNRRIEFKIRN